MRPRKNSAGGRAASGTIGSYPLWSAGRDGSARQRDTDDAPLSDVAVSSVDDQRDGLPPAATNAPDANTNVSARALPSLRQMMPHVAPAHRVDDHLRDVGRVVADPLQIARHRRRRQRARDVLRAQVLIRK